MANEDLSFVVALPPVILYFYILFIGIAFTQKGKKKNLFSKTVLSILSLLPEDLQQDGFERDQRSLPKVLTEQ